MQTVGFPVSKENAICGYMLYLSASDVGKKSMDALRSEYIEELTQIYRLGLHKRREEKQALERSKKAEEENARLEEERRQHREERAARREEDRKRREAEREARRAARLEAQRQQELQEADSWADSLVEDNFTWDDRVFEKLVTEEEPPEKISEEPQGSASDFLSALANIQKADANYTDHGKLITDCAVIEKPTPVSVEPIYTTVETNTTTHGKSILDCIVITKKKNAESDLGYSYDEPEEIVSSSEDDFSFMSDYEEDLIEEVPEVSVEVKEPKKPVSKVEEPSKNSVGSITVADGNRVMMQNRTPKKSQPKQDYGELNEDNVRLFVKANRGCTLRDIMTAFSGCDEKKVVAVVKKAKQTNRVQEKHGKYEV